jgi:hypothetical protein
VTNINQCKSVATLTDSLSIRRIKSISLPFPNHCTLMGNPQLICSARPSDYSDRFVLPDNDARFTEEDLIRQIASAIQA